MQSGDKYKNEIEASRLQERCKQLFDASKQLRNTPQMATEDERVRIQDKINEYLNVAGNLRRDINNLDGAPWQNLKELVKKSENVLQLHKEIARMFKYLKAKNKLLSATEELIHSPQMVTEDESFKDKITKYFDSVSNLEGGIKIIDASPLQDLEALQTRSENPLKLDEAHAKMFDYLNKKRITILPSRLPAATELLPQQDPKQPQLKVLVKGYSDGQKAQDSQSQFGAQLEKQPTTTVKPICPLILPSKPVKETKQTTVSDDAQATTQSTLNQQQQHYI